MANRYDIRGEDHYEIAWTPEKEKAVLGMIDEYLRCWGTGESIMQVDDAQVGGLELLCDIADLVEAQYIEE